MINKIFIFWLLFIPAINWNGVYEGYKVLFFWIGSFFLLTYWLIKKRKQILESINIWDYFYWSWILVLIISSILGNDPISSIVGGSYRHQGVIFFISLWVIGKTFGFLSKKEKAFFSKSISYFLILQSLIVFFQLIFNKGLVFGRPMGTFGEANAVAGYLALGSFFTSNIYVLLTALLAIFLTGSRSGLIAFFVILFSHLKVSRKTKVVLLVVFGLLFLFVWQRRQFVEVGPYKFEDRFIFAQLSVESIFQKPLIGYGAETGEIVFNNAFKEKKIKLGNFMVDRSHNLFLDVAIWSGFSGLLLFSTFLFGNIYSIYKAKDRRKLYGAIAFLAFSLLQPLGVTHWTLFFLILLGI